MAQPAELHCRAVNDGDLHLFACKKGVWTELLDRDDPFGSGDWEGRASHYSEGRLPCEYPSEAMCWVTSNRENGELSAWNEMTRSMF